VRGVLVDTADVLYDATLWPRQLVRLVHGLGVPAAYPQWIVPWQRDYLVDVHCGRREYSEALQAFLLAAGLSWAQIDEVEAASRIERQQLELDVRPLPGVQRAIARLHESGLRLAAWADTCQPTAGVAARLERLGLSGRFCAVLSSFDLEAAQPAPRCYQAALDALALPAAELAYVGHDAEHLAAARAAGLATIAFNHPPHAEADFHLTAFDELAALLTERVAADSVAAGGSA
jgi:FMN phosphatase YigB (HAD superfamily)